MSESGGFGDGGGGWSGGGSDWGGTSTQSDSGGGGSAAVGPSEGGTFGDSFFNRDSSWNHHQHSDPSMANVAEAGIAGYILGRDTASRGVDWRWGAYPQPGYVVTSPGSSVYTPIVPGPAVQYQTGVPLPRYQHRYQVPQTQHGGYPSRDAGTQRRRLFNFCLAAAWIAAFCLYFVAFASHTVELRDKEQHLLFANSWFASGIAVKPSGNTRQRVAFSVSVYSFPSHPALSKAAHFDLGKPGVQVPRFGYQVWPVWLNRGSEVQVVHRVLSNSMLKLAVVEGRESVEKWKEDPRDQDDSNSGVVLQRNIQGEGTVTFRAKRDGLFFFSLANFFPRDATLDLALHVTSLEFDLTEARPPCDLSSYGAKPCQVPTPLGGPNYAVLASSPGGDPSRPMREITVLYEPRGIAYLLLLACPWIVVYLHAVFLKAHTQQQQQQQQQQSEVHSNNAPVVGQESMGTVITPLPPVPAGPGAAPSSGPASKVPIPASWVSSSAPPAPPAQETTPLVAAAAPSAPSAPRMEEEVVQAAGSAGGAGSGAGEAAGDSLCSICMEKPKDAVILNCGHRATCLDCANLLQSGRSPLCPICRRPIERVQRLYDA